MRSDLLRTLATNFGSNSALAAKAIREMYARDPYYEIADEGPPSPTHLVKVQVYASSGVG